MSLTLLKVLREKENVVTVKSRYQIMTTTKTNETELKQQFKDACIVSNRDNDESMKLVQKHTSSNNAAASFLSDRGP